MVELPDIYHFTDGALDKVDTAKVYDKIKSYIRDGVGEDVILDEHTILGAVISLITYENVKIINDIIQNLPYFLDPTYARGTNLDNIASRYNIYRGVGRPTQVKCHITGKPYAIVPSGTLVQDNYGRNWENETEYTLDSNGVNDNCVFFCTIEGAITLSDNEITKFVTTDLNLYTITNEKTLDTDIGVEAESDTSLSMRVATKLNANSLAPGVLKSDLLNIAGVADVLFYTNPDTENEYINYKGCKILKGQSLLVLQFTLSPDLYPEIKRQIGIRCYRDLIANYNLVSNNELVPSDIFTEIEYNGSKFYYCEAAQSNIYLKMVIYNPSNIYTTDFINNLKSYIIRHQYDISGSGRRVCTIGEDVSTYEINDIIQKQFQISYVRFEISADGVNWGTKIINNDYSTIYIFNKDLMDVSFG